MKSESFDKLTAESGLWIAGAVLVVAGLGWFLLEAIAAAQFPAYSYAHNYISDLGVPELGMTEGRYMNSPLSWLANWMFITQGILFLVAAVLVVRTATAGVGRRVFLLLAVVYAIGFALIGTFHGSAQAVADGTYALHVLGGSLSAVCGILAIIVAGLSARRLGASVAYRAFSVGIGILGIVSMVMLSIIHDGNSTFNLIPVGIWERGICYAVIIWEIVTGAVLLVAGKTPITPSTGDAATGPAPRVPGQPDGARCPQL